MPLKHRFISTKPDSVDTSLVRPSNWNEDHKVEPGAPGSVLFVGENQSVSEDNANLFWDNVNKRLGIRTNTPAATLDINGDIKAANATLSTLTAGSILFTGLNGIISQDNANLFWDNVNKRLGIRWSTPYYTLDVYGITATRSLFSFHNADNPYSSTVRLYKSRGTYGSPTAVQSGDEMGTLSFAGYSGTTYIASACIQAKVDDTPTTTSVPSRIEFLTFPVGGTGWLIRMVIKNDGKIGIGTIAPEFLVDSRGDLCVNRTADADSSNTLRNSFNLVLRGAYWTGSASANRDAVIFHRMLSTTPTSEIAFQIAGVDLAMLRNEIADGETALLIRRNVGGTYSVVRVSMGPPDSGGTGYRVLRVPN